MTRHSIEHVMETYSIPMLKLAIVYVKDRQIAEDIVQEVFIQFHYSDQYEERGQLKSYLMTLTANRCKNYLKSWSYRMVQLKDQIQDRMVKKRDSLVTSEEKRELAQLLMALPLKYREVLYGFYYEELKISEIGQLFCLSENTVKTRLRKAKQLLRERLPQQQWEVLGHDTFEESV